MRDNRTAICVVDSDPVLASALGSLLQRYGICVRRFDEFPEFLAVLDSGCFDGSVLFLDLDACAAEPAALLEEIRASAARLSVVAVTSDWDADLRERVVAAGALELVRRPLLAAYVFNRLREELPGGQSLPREGMMTLSLRDGTPVTFRMMQPEDADIEQAFVTSLSERSRSQRFFSGLRQLTPRMLALLTNPDYPKSYALIATVTEGGRERQIGVARYAPTGEEGVAEFAVVVSDEWQGHGVGSELLQLVIIAAAIAGLRRLEGVILRENERMLTLAKKLGFVVEPGSPPDASTVLVARQFAGQDQLFPVA
jgi:RimJ/RimL family protein N-acetyltransferase